MSLTRFSGVIRLEAAISSLMNELRRPRPIRQVQAENARAKGLHGLRSFLCLDEPPRICRILPSHLVLLRSFNLRLEQDAAHAEHCLRKCHLSIWR